MKKSLFFILGFFFLNQATAQIAVGEFRSHIALRGFYSVAVDDDYVYAATDKGLMLMDKATKDRDLPEMSTWTKVEGLSDIDIAKIYYDKNYKILIISYKNGNIDLVKNDNVINISDIKNKQIPGSKELSHIHTQGNIAYLVYPFGIVCLNLEEFLITDTWFTKRNDQQYNAIDIAITPDRYYLATEKGIFSLATTQSNPANFLSWNEETSVDSGEFDRLLYFDGKVYANKNTGNNIDIHDSARSDDTLYVLHQGLWLPTSLSCYDMRDLACVDTEMIICDWNFVEVVEVLDTGLTKTFYAELWGDTFSYPNIMEVVSDDGLLWVADRNNGLVQVNRKSNHNRFYTGNGPYDNRAEAICSRNGITLLVPGSRHEAAFAPGWIYPSLSIFKNQKWTHVADFLTYTSDKRTYDLNNIIINPANDREWYVASWGNGLFKCTDEVIAAHYGAGNSPLDSTSNGQVFVSGLDYDDKGNLWLTNSQSAKMLKMIEPDGTWHAYNVGRGVITSGYTNVVAEHVMVDSRNYKWITYPRGSNFNKCNLVAFSENGTYDNPGDDRLAIVDMNAEAEVNSSTVLCIAEDLDGEIWIGTDKGIKVIYNPSNIFKSNIYPHNILLKQDGYVSVLLEFEEVTAIAVDGANRKWIGTSKAGVFLMSEDGQEQLLHFTAEDNPLFSNQIVCITIDPQSGEVFFGTGKGVVSYRGVATEGRDQYEELTVFPNPVRHGYTGYVSVNGLKTNSLCKITDASGRLVWQGYSYGGQMVWNCRDNFGRRPATGIYYVMVSEEDGKEKMVAKFLFIH